VIPQPGLAWAASGIHLSELAPDAALGVIAGLLRRLRVAAGEPFRSLACSR
jgi:hypothetical protein